MSVARAARPILLVLAAFAAACGDSTGPGLSGTEGVLRFTYSGTVSGNFVAEGAIDMSSPSGLPTSAGAVAMEEGGMFAVVGVRPTTGNRIDMFALSLGNMQGTGTVNINLIACQDIQSGTCPSGVFMLDVDPARAVVAPEPTLPDTPMYILMSGSITVTSRSATRIRGSFSGSAMSTDLASLRMITISGGSFDVPIIVE